MKKRCAFLIVITLVSCQGLGAAVSNPAPVTPTASAYVGVETLPTRPMLSAETQTRLAALKPIFDGRSLDGWHQAPMAPFRVAREDVPNPSALARRLVDKSNAIGTRLLEAFDEPGRAAVQALSESESNAASAIGVVLRNLNRLAAGPDFVTPETLARVQLRPETILLQRMAPSGLQLARLNRLLLEDAFPGELVRRPSTGWIARDGIMASTGAARGVIYTAADYTHYRLVFQVRQIKGNHVPGVLIFCTRPTSRDDLTEAQAGIDALGAIQFQVPNGGHWDYRPGKNQAGASFNRPIRIRFNLQEWSQVELLVNARTGLARMAVAQPVGTRGMENLVFSEVAAGRTGPIALQMHNAGLFDEFRDLRIEINPAEDRLLILE